jgi:hypothetical protein
LLAQPRSYAALLRQRREQQRKTIQHRAVDGCDARRLLGMSEKICLSVRRANLEGDKVVAEFFPWQADAENVILVNAFWYLLLPEGSSSEFVGVSTLGQQDVPIVQSAFLNLVLGCLDLVNVA